MYLFNLLVKKRMGRHGRNTPKTDGQVARGCIRTKEISKRMGEQSSGGIQEGIVRLTKAIEEIDRNQNQNEGGENTALRRVQLEAELEKLMESEEIYLQQRGGERWILEGDANTNFFHLVANGRRRKKMITSLEHEGIEVTDREGIQLVICGF